MNEARGDLWEYPADYRCITTNGYVKTNGEAVMGRGCALEAAQKWPALPEVLGEMIKAGGNHVYELGFATAHDEVRSIRHAWNVLSFPVKHHWREKADLDLIRRSANELDAFLTQQMLWDDIADDFTVVLPRPGCGNGQLDWEDVRPILNPILDDRFTVITFA